MHDVDILYFMEIINAKFQIHKKNQTKNHIHYLNIPTLGFNKRMSEIGFLLFNKQLVKLNVRWSFKVTRVFTICSKTFIYSLFF